MHLDATRLAPQATPKQSSLSRWIPYVVAAVSVPIVYLTVVAMLDRQMLAAVLASIVSLTLLTIIKTWQTRGRLSLAATTIVLPLLAALCCVALLKLAPLAERQAAIEQLRAANIQSRLKAPSIQGEWAQDSSGFLIPVWLARWFGPDCLTEVRELDFDLADVGDINFDSIPTGALREVKIRRARATPKLAKTMVDWLNTLSDVQLTIQFESVTDNDLKEIARIKPGLLNNVHLDFGSEPIRPVSNTTYSSRVVLGGSTLSAEVARQLVSVRTQNTLTSFLVPKLEPGAAEVLVENKSRFLRFDETELTASEIAAISSGRLRHLVLFDCSLPSASEIRDAAAARGQAKSSSSPAPDDIRWLTIYEGSSNLNQILTIAEAFECYSLSCDLVLDKAEASRILTSTRLTSVDCITLRNDEYVRVRFVSGESPEYFGRPFNAPRLPDSGSKVKDW
ncbi:MAG TPA: hypothetical protein DDW52_01640 [Planctomycetaceae bacterium]|nr:hypothetical protein [Planctomycetaceae bacterium]